MHRSNLLGALVAALLVPASAGAATVSLSGGTLHVDDAVPTDNTITINYTGGS